MNKPGPLPSDLESLFVERERAQVTLDSIGDAVVSTDFRGHVTYLNKAAQHLTGFPQEAASGRPIGEVFRLVDAVSRRPVACPVAESIIENQKRSVGAHCLLVHRENTLVPVDVSATPYYKVNHMSIGWTLRADPQTRGTSSAESDGGSRPRMKSRDTCAPHWGARSS
jgi:PAS domain S-box-containing protein